MHIKTIGLDLAKSVFQAHGVDEAGDVVLVKKLHRKQMVPFFVPPDVRFADRGLPKESSPRAPKSETTY